MDLSWSVRFLSSPFSAPVAQDCRNSHNISSKPKLAQLPRRRQTGKPADAGADSESDAESSDHSMQDASQLRSQGLDWDRVSFADKSPAAGTKPATSAKSGVVSESSSESEQRFDDGKGSPTLRRTVRDCDWVCCCSDTPRCLCFEQARNGRGLFFEAVCASMRSSCANALTAKVRSCASLLLLGMADAGFA